MKKSVALPSGARTKRIPCATYRLQFNRNFTFQQAGEILDYLGDLGITDIYVSPVLQAGPESTHGYDTCCFAKINPNLGTEEDFEQLTSDLKKRQLGLLLDIVPNHMSATLANAWWSDVLENGTESAYAEFFDIDWHTQRPGLRNNVLLLPVLEDHYGKVLEGGKLQLVHGGGRFFIAYHDRNFPVNARTLPKDAAKKLSRTLREFNGTPGRPSSFDNLDALIRQQHYRLAYWKIASEEINYRRFFDVTEMVALRMELPKVFRATHQLILKWLHSGKITGLRVDHPDGLWDPKEYLQRLQKDHQHPYIVVEKILTDDELLPDDWPVDGTTGYDFLNRVNGLFVNGSNASAFNDIYQRFTGCNTDFGQIVYDSRKMVLERSFASEMNALTNRLLNLASRTRSGRDFTFTQLRAASAAVIACFPVYRTYVTEKSDAIPPRDRLVVSKALSEARGRSKLDPPVFNFIEKVLTLETAEELDETGTKDLREFVMKFQQLTSPAMAKGLEDTAFYRFNRLVSLNEVGGDPGRFGITSDEFHHANNSMVRRWPHTMLASATHDTKRGEDVRARINVLSEMPDEWREALARWSHLNAEKKSAVGNMPAPDANDEYLLYQTLVGAWPAEAERSGNLKAFCARVVAFMLKAPREAKIHTSWTECNGAYEDALKNFAERILTNPGSETFLVDLQRFARRVAFFGRVNSLAQTSLKITSPGMPDFYQGSELWDLNLVDPDNRRPVDYSLRKELLSELKQRFARENGEDLISNLLRDDKIGISKLFLIWRALNFRKERREVFEKGEYVPVPATGEKKEHVLAFGRIWKERVIVIAVPRLVFGLTNGAQLMPLGHEIWGKTSLHLPREFAGRIFHNVLTGEEVAPIEHDGARTLEMGQLLKHFPVALIERVGKARRLR